MTVEIEIVESGNHILACCLIECANMVGLDTVVSTPVHTKAWFLAMDAKKKRSRRLKKKKSRRHKKKCSGSSVHNTPTHHKPHANLSQPTTLSGIDVFLRLKCLEYEVANSKRCAEIESPDSIITASSSVENDVLVMCDDKCDVSDEVELWDDLTCYLQDSSQLYGVTPDIDELFTMEWDHLFE
jgi:hypothetical protein